MTTPNSRTVVVACWGTTWSPGTFPYFCEPDVGLGVTGVIRVD